MTEELKAMLGMHPEKNIAALSFFDNFPVQQSFIYGNSAIIFGESDNYWAHFVSDSEKELSVLLNTHHKRTSYYYSVEDWMIPCILKHGQVDWSMSTKRYILDKDVQLALPKLEIVKLNKSYASFIYTNSDYKKYTNVKYIEEMLCKDVSAGIFAGKQLAAWGFTHDDGALGFLHVLPEYRKNGFAKEIVLSLVNQQRKLKKPIFCNIVPENEVAIDFITKLGFHFDRNISWLKLK